MDKFDRIFQLHAILSARRTPIALETLMARLECSKSKLHRAIATLKNHLDAPVVFDTNVGGYKYDRAQGEAYELPGLWFLGSTSSRHSRSCSDSSRMPAAGCSRST